MTVKQLIDGLGHYDPDIEVFFFMEGFILAQNPEWPIEKFSVGYEDGETKPSRLLLIFDPE